MKPGARQSFIPHVFFWLALYAIWVILFRAWSFSLSRSMTVEFCYLIFITAGFYALHYFAIPRFFDRQQYFMFSILVAGILVLAAAFRTGLAIFMNTHYFHTITPPGAGKLFLDSLLNISIWIGIVTVCKLFADKRRAHSAFAALERQKISSELDYLKAQINPHTLFNSLNTIYGSIDKRNQTARNALLQFSELLRYQLYDCAAEKVSLEQEINYIKNYVEFHRLRKNNDLNIIITADVKHGGLSVAPLLLMVLVENAFKFVSSVPDYENNITITITADQSELECRVANTKDRKLPSTRPGGIGITNLQRRLELLYPAKFRYTISDTGDRYESKLILDLS